MHCYVFVLICKYNRYFKKHLITYFIYHFDTLLFYCGNCFNKVFDVGKFTSLYSKVTSVKRSLWVPPAGDCLIQV